MAPDHYQVLGVDETAELAEIRTAYHRLMRATHPDRRPGDDVAAQVARDANAAWSVLRNANRRRSYDAARRGAGAPARPVTSAHRSHAGAAQRPRTQVYSPAQSAYRRALSAACLKVAAAVFAGGFALLLTSF